MTDTIWRYTLRGATSDVLQFPDGYVIRHFAHTRDFPQVWVQHMNPQRVHMKMAVPLVTVEFRILPTGAPITDDWHYVGTSVIDDLSVWHCFYREVRDE